MCHIVAQNLQSVERICNWVGVGRAPNFLACVLVKDWNPALTSI
jgi:hypothetical protein